MGASGSKEVDKDEPEIVTVKEAVQVAEGARSAALIKKIDELERIVRIAPAREGVWNDLLFLTDLGGSPGIENCEKNLAELWKALLQWSRKNGALVSENQAEVMELIGKMHPLAMKYEQSSRGVYNESKQLSDSLSKIESLKKVVEDVSRDVVGLTGQIQDMKQNQA